MSDGMSDSRREERALNQVETGFTSLTEGFNSLYDSIFGLPCEVVEDLRKILKRYGLHVVNSHGFTSSQIATKEAREAISFVPPNER